MFRKEGNGSLTGDLQFALGGHLSEKGCLSEIMKEM